jgi:SAM-dependent methyltransferase
MPPPDRSTARRLAQESLAKGDVTGWFDALYASAEGDASQIPWADLHVNPNLTSWLTRYPLRGDGKRALVVGCGLGDDAEEFAALGFQVTAFDLSATAIEWCRRRYPDSGVTYVVADLLQPPEAWRGAFDFVFEGYTLQVLPPEARGAAAEQLTACVAPRGTLLVIARGREPADERGTMPWPLTKAELEALASDRLTIVSFEGYFDNEDPPTRRFRVEYRRTV